MSSIGISEGVYGILERISEGYCLNEQFLRAGDKKSYFLRVVRLTTSSTGGVWISNGC